MIPFETAYWLIVLVMVLEEVLVGAMWTLWRMEADRCHQ